MLEFQNVLVPRKILVAHNKKPFPEIIFVYANKNAKKVLEDTIKKILEREDNLSFHLTSWEEIKTQGIKREVLHKAEVKNEI